MKLDRNITKPRRGKYALIKLRNIKPFNNLQFFKEVKPAGEPLFSMVPSSEIDFGCTRETDFFVIRLKDKYAGAALHAYAEAASACDPEYAAEIDMLAPPP